MDTFFSFPNDFVDDLDRLDLALVAHAAAAKSTTPVQSMTEGVVQITDSTPNVARSRPPNWGRSARANVEQPFDFSLSGSTAVFRTTLELLDTDTHGSSILDVSSPYEILMLSTTQSLQNMPFNNFVYVVFDHVSMHVQVNGQPFQQGRYICAFIPYVLVPPGPTRNAIRLCQANNGVYIDPASSRALTVTAPFVAWRDCMNTLAAGEVDEYNGLFTIRCVQPIAASETGSSSCRLTISFTFSGLRPNTPRPEFPLLRDQITEKVLSHSVGYRHLRQQIANEERRDRHSSLTHRDRSIRGLIAHGGKVSTVNHIEVNESAVGSVRPETDMSGATATGAEVDTELSGTLMDHTPLLGGGIPAVMQYPSLSATVGVHALSSMQLSPAAPSRGHPDLQGAYGGVDSLNYLCRPTLYSLFEFPNTAQPGDILFTVPLTVGPATWQGVLDQGPTTMEYFTSRFLMWRGDIICDVTPICSAGYQSASIAVSFSYGFGSPPASYQEASHSYTQTLNISEGSRTTRERTTWIQALPVLEVPNANSTLVPDPIQNYTLGWLTISVVNPIQNAASALDSFFVQLDLGFEGQLFVPRGTTIWQPNSDSYGARDAPVPLVAHSGVPAAEINEDNEPTPEHMAIDARSVKLPPKDESIVFPSHLPFPVRTYTMFNKRMRVISPNEIYRFVFAPEGGNTKAYSVWTFSVGPRLLDLSYFGAFRGSMELFVQLPSTFADGTSCDVLFSPLVKYSVTNTGVARSTAVSMMSMAGYAFHIDDYATTFDAPNHALNGTAIGTVALEKTFPAGTNFLRVEIPYQQIFSMINCNATEVNPSYPPTELGQVCIVIPDRLSSPNPIIMVSAGDEVKVAGFSRYTPTQRTNTSVGLPDNSHMVPFGYRLYDF